MLAIFTVQISAGRCSRSTLRMRYSEPMSRRRWTWILAGIAAFVGVGLWLRSQMTFPPEQADAIVGMRGLHSASFHDSNRFHKWLLDRDLERRPDAYADLFVRFAKEGGYYEEVRGLDAPIEFYRELLAYGHDPDPQVRLAVVYALAFSHHRRELKPSLEPIIATLLQDVDGRVVQGAIDLADACGPPAGDAIRQLVYSERAATRLAAARALARILGHSDPDSKDLEAIKHLINDEDERVRKTVQFALQRSSGIIP